jgi:hypothetical protein
LRKNQAEFDQLFGLFPTRPIPSLQAKEKPAKRARVFWGIIILIGIVHESLEIEYEQRSEQDK